MSRRKPYHHGNLKTALVDMALEELERVPAERISLRALAQRLGVSANAPYNHFADRDALLAAIASRGFESLDEAFEGRDSLSELGRAYVDFVTERPALAELMFRSAPTETDCERPGATAYERLRKASVDETAALAAWCLVHGLAQLRAMGAVEDVEPMELVRALGRQVESERA